MGVWREVEGWKKCRLKRDGRPKKCGRLEGKKVEAETWAKVLWDTNKIFL